jgi:hypothetical protein
MNAGQKTIEWLRDEQLQVDDEWSVRRPAGFTWWAHRHAQHVDVVRDYDGPGGDKGYIVRIRTEFLRKSGRLEPTGGDAAALELLMSTASMSGLVHDESEGVLYLSSAVRVHEGIWQWMARLLSVSSMLQLADAHLMADQFGPLLGATSAASDHPSSGTREEPDEITASFPSMSHAQGQQSCLWTAHEFAEVLPLMQAQPMVMASGGGAGVTIEFPYGRRTSLCRMVGTEPHPRLGNGLFLLQSFPVEHLGLSDAALMARALQENASELSLDPKGYGLGSYCYRDGCIHWTSFLPNLAYAQGLLPNLFAASAGRAVHMAAALAPRDAQRGSAKPQSNRPPSAMERILRFFGGKQ